MPDDALPSSSSSSNSSTLFQLHPYLIATPEVGQVGLHPSLVPVLLQSHWAYAEQHAMPGSVRSSIVDTKGQGGHEETERERRREGLSKRPADPAASPQLTTAPDVRDGAKTGRSPSFDCPDLGHSRSAPVRPGFLSTKPSPILRWPVLDDNPFGQSRLSGPIFCTATSCIALEGRVPNFHLQTKTTFLPQLGVPTWL
ncbi:hypothetical protein TgHK011_009675 [Trichoderma gracile]|nr:hypothetical protein TgHK011_009675 [Trichoderma gracile]